MASLHPASFLGLEHGTGQIAQGRYADLLAIDDGLIVRQSWIRGQVLAH